MKKRVNEYIEQIKTAKQENKQLTQFIDAKTAEFEASIANEQQAIKRNTEMIRNIRHMEMRAELSEVVNQLAMEWGTTPENMQVSIRPNLHRVVEKNTMKDNYLIDILNFQKLHFMFMTIDFTQLSQDKESVVRNMQIIRPFNLFARQKDGRQIIAHMVPEVTPVNNNSKLCHVNVVVDNVDDIILDFDMMSVILALEESDNTFGRALVNAIDVYNHQQNQAEMGE